MQLPTPPILSRAAAQPRRASTDAKCRCSVPMWPSALQGHVLERAGVGKAGDLAERGVAVARTDPVQEGELPERRVDRLLVHELLHLGKDRGPLFRVELLGLLRVEGVDIGGDRKSTGVNS